ncbi:Glycoside hydrolase superfamily [Penicillium atrosanguineum]|uniref:Glycoside hydrolase superfamily n=1 Tax=Penicillium atrosanguineum TaxID=1132637 RepID=UPI00239D0220|nr:Glycoside hydrolase superfamily [Penicillium atrosanguineum]KAJ5309395.1 Glycoside hydrolase superfamily [Penicillium atrosanguineum]
MLGTWALRRVQHGPRTIRAVRQAPRDPRFAPSNAIHHLAVKRIVVAQDVRLNSCTRTRGLATAAIPSVLVPPLIFVGLLLSLWTWKCFWIVVMQDKLLYLTWLPPFTRSEKIADYEFSCRPVRWEEKQIRSLDGTKLAICEGQIANMSDGKGFQQTSKFVRKRRVVICYFQGNGGSMPMRLPLLSQVLRTITEKSKSTTKAHQNETKYTIAALSYRGYWKSSGRATQSGIEKDAQAFLNWVSETYKAPETDLEIVLWGHSLGAAVASAATAAYLARQHSGQTSAHKSSGSLAPLVGLILEAPTSSIKDMLISLYPQKWLPYRYLWPLSWNTWDITKSMSQMARWRDESGIEAADPPSRLPPIFLLSAEKDEIIPSCVPGHLERCARSFNLDLEAKEVVGAMHTEAPLKLDGRKALVDFILNTSR